MANEYLIIVDQDLNVSVQNNVAQVQVTSPAFANEVSVVSPVTPNQVTVQTTGLPGPAGPAGEGVPAGGNAGEFLAKIDGTDYNTQWTTASTGHIVADEGTPVPQRGTINFLGAGVVVSDNAGNDSSDVTISAGGTSDHGALTGLLDDDHTQYALADGTRGNFEPTGTASSEVATHVAAPDPHSQYLIQAETDALYEDIGSTTAHVAELDPHTQYQKESEKSAANGYASLGADTKVPIAEIPTGSTNSTVSLGDHDHAGVYDPSGTATSAVSTHEGLLDPHSQYLTPAEADLAYDAIGAASSGDSAHTAAGDPHPQYLTSAEGDAAYDAIGAASTAVTNHEAAVDPHSNYLEPDEILAGTNVTVDIVTTPGSVIINSTAAGGSGHTIQEEGAPLAQRTNLNFVGTNVAATDDVGNDATVVTLSDQVHIGPSEPTGNEVVWLDTDEPSANIDTFSRSATLVVAASNASTQSKQGADYVCDGTADEVEINLALAALPTNGGKLVLTEGTFQIASSILVQNDNAYITGAGTGQRVGGSQTGTGTRLEAANTITGAVILVQGLANDRPVYGVHLEHFTIDGGYYGTAVDGILFRSNRGQIEHVHVHRVSGAGFRILGYPTWDTYDTILAFCQSGNNTGAGFHFDADSPDGHMLHCISFDNNDNLLIEAASQQITSCHFYTAARHNIFFDGGGSRTKITNCKIEGAGQHGVNIDSTNGGYADIQITGCGISTNGRDVDNTYDGIILQGPSGNGIARTMIANNAIGNKNSVSANKIRYGVNLAGSAAQGTGIFGNVFGPSPSSPTGTYQIQTASINNNGSSSTPATIGANVGWVNKATGAATVAATTTSIAVTHGLSDTPDIENIQVTPTNSMNAATKFWVSNPTATQFTINVDQSPGAADTATFAWRAEVT